jgi:hypothetical protein
MILLEYFLEATLSMGSYGAIFAAWWRYVQCQQESRNYRPSFHLLLAATLMWAQIYCVIFLLGVLKLLDRSLVLAVNAGISCFLLGFTHRRPPDRRGLFAMISTRTREILGTKPSDPLLLPAIGICGIALVWFAILNIAFPPSGYDDFVFHLPSSALYFQQHSFSLVGVAPVQELSTARRNSASCFRYFSFRSSATIGWFTFGPSCSLSSICFPSTRSAGR